MNSACASSEPLDRRDTKGGRLDAWISALVVAFVFENAVLAAINNLAFQLNSKIVMTVQLALTFAAVVIVLVRRPSLGLPFLMGIGAILLCVMMKVVYTGSADYRFVYDIAVIPIFIAVGAAAERFDARLMLSITLVLVGGALLEMIAPQVYSGIFNPFKYFYFTRDWVSGDIAPSDALYSGAGFYMGVIREGGTFFGADHRISSLFLEPISLGYYAAIVGAFSLYGRAQSLTFRILGYAACMFLAMASDTRVAVFLLLAMLALKPFMPLMSRLVVVLLPFLALVTIFVIFPLTKDMQGDMGLRLAITVRTLLGSNFLDVLVGGVDASEVYDSGYIYLIANAGIIGFMLYPVIASGALLKNRDAVPLYFAIILYLVVTFIFSCAPLSVKTASVLGYGLGVFGRDHEEDGEEPSSSI